MYERMFFKNCFLVLHDMVAFRSGGSRKPERMLPVCCELHRHPLR